MPSKVKEKDAKAKAREHAVLGSDIQEAMKAQVETPPEDEAPSEDEAPEEEPEG